MSEDTSVSVGIDLGGTSTGIGLVSAAGELLAEDQFPTAVERGHRLIIEEMAERVRKLCRREGVELTDTLGVGVGSPGPLDPKTGVVLVTPNLKWRNVPLRDLLAERLETRVVVDNDAVCATFGEWWVGAGRPFGDVVGLTLGTGVGGGIVLNGRIHHGFQGTGGHLGHTIIRAGGRRCTCGNDGCLEAYASATAITDRAAEVLAEHPASTLAQFRNSLTSRKVFEAARGGDPLACRIFDETGFFLAVGVNNVLNTLNPEAVVIMGAVAGAGEILFEPLHRHLKRIAFERIYQGTRVLPGELGEAAGMIGAAGLLSQLPDYS